MNMACPPLVRKLVIADDAQLAAHVSCAMARPGQYLPVLETMRKVTGDPNAELGRRLNMAGRIRPEAILFVGLSDEDADALSNLFPRQLKAITSRINEAEEADILRPATAYKRPPLRWGRDRIGIGLLKALREQRSIEFFDETSPAEEGDSKSGHYVICEEGEPMAEVIAANYAYSLRAGLRLIPAIDRNRVDDLLEEFYGVLDDPTVSVTDTMGSLQRRLKSLSGDVNLPAGSSATYITGGLPLGFGTPEVPSTHLFKYPDLGLSVANGFVAEQEGRPGIGLVALVSPDIETAQEIDAVQQWLGPRGALFRAYSSRRANVSSVSAAMELLPYDLMVIATHCGDTPGHRWTYEFTDSEKIDRNLVVDIALGVGQTDDPDILEVTQFIRFISLDGVDWRDSEAKRELYIGRAIEDFIAMTRPGSTLQPVKKETVDRVVGSAALRMSDDNLIVLPKVMGSDRTPIIINNACSSWHRLALNFMVGGVRAYVSTLIPITGSDAEAMTTRLLGKHHGKPMAAALWSTQREIYGADSPRRPFVIAGVYPQRLRVEGKGAIARTMSRLSSDLNGWRKVQGRIDPQDSQRMTVVAKNIAFYEREIEALEEDSHAKSRL